MYRNYDGSLYSITGRNKKFTEVWSDVDSFLTDYANAGIPTTIKTENAKVLYYLLYAKYGNDRIASADPERFKYSVFGIIYSKGLAWVQRLSIQQELAQLDLTKEDWKIGTTLIYNHANNPSTAPGTSTTEELDYLDSQNTTKSKKGKLEGYNDLLALLKTDVTEQFLTSFEKLFTKILTDEVLLYGDEEEG